MDCFGKRFEKDWVPHFPDCDWPRVQEFLDPILIRLKDVFRAQSTVGHCLENKRFNLLVDDFAFELFVEERLWIFF